MIWLDGIGLVCWVWVTQSSCQVTPPRKGGNVLIVSYYRVKTHRRWNEIILINIIVPVPVPQPRRFDLENVVYSVCALKKWHFFPGNAVAGKRCRMVVGLWVGVFPVFLLRTCVNCLSGLRCLAKNVLPLESGWELGLRGGGS